eukprot:560411-Pelagomonas_calceolata.AAC.4
MSATFSAHSQNLSRIGSKNQALLTMGRPNPRVTRQMIKDKSGQGKLNFSMTGSGSTRNSFKRLG